MKAKKILFATDYSKHSEVARQIATSLARDSGAMLLIVHAVESPVHGPDRGFGGYIEQAEDTTSARRQLDETVPADPQVGYAQKLLDGVPSDEIVRCAEEEGVDLIVIGSHGRTGLMRMLLGSVAEAVVRRAKCPVLTVKQPNNVAEAVEV